MAPSQRPINRILVVNRGEIAIRILQACHELPSPPVTFALYTENDATHVSLGRPQQAIKIHSPSVYMNIDAIIKICKDNRIDSIHPGYGFLSESADFSRRLWEEANVLVIGPGWEVLQQTGDKLKAKALAEECNVPVLKAMKTPSKELADVRSFAKDVGFPIMIKAVDGGGGRGIRLVKNDGALQNAVERCIGESPSGRVFAEQAAVHGFKHIEVQIIGDGKGGVCHLWERDCSVQRRFQKIVEVAPAPVQDRQTIGQVIQSAMNMASRLHYLGLGTFEYLVNVESREFFFLEINPRVQVEHTISESMQGVDLVRAQLFIAQGQIDPQQARFGKLGDCSHSPQGCSIQLRLCAEDPESNFSLSMGKVTRIITPGGNGVRIDSHLSQGGSIGSDFDNLMAKIIVTAADWKQTVAKTRRVLTDIRINGLKTNLDLLRGILADEGFCAGQADTEWLEKNMRRLVLNGKELSAAIESATSELPELPAATSSTPEGVASSGVAFRKGDAWSLHMEGAEDTPKDAHHLSIQRIVRNEFPETLVADISFTVPGQEPLLFKATMKSTASSSQATASSHRRGDGNNPDHVVAPMNGKLIEVLVEEGDKVQENDVIAFVKQMKMELEIRCPKSGTVGWVIELDNEEGDDVAEGVLIAELKSQSSEPRIQSKL